MQRKEKSSGSSILKKRKRIEYEGKMKNLKEMIGDDNTKLDNTSKRSKYEQDRSVPTLKKL